ncbi:MULTISPECIES: hypothetical protein [Kitasatospora]|uniref:hypothetical protein n=1 Tax=Kitasatospora TaxID=2063 RepID=UPI0002E754FD|nr:MULTISPECIES: hypothetical protein [Kitasatospora]
MTSSVLPPLPAVLVPPRRAVPDFPPIRATARGRHRVRRALLRCPGPVAAGALALAAALLWGAPPPAPPPGGGPAPGAAGCPSAST